MREIIKSSKEEEDDVSIGGRYWRSLATNLISMSEQEDEKEQYKS